MTARKPTDQAEPEATEPEATEGPEPDPNGTIDAEGTWRPG